MSNLSTLQVSLSAFHNATATGKENREAAKSEGATIAETVRKAFASNDTETIQWLETETENKNPALKSAKGYVSKGRTVGKSSYGNDERSVSTLYDIIQKEKEANKETQAAINEKAIRNNAALLAVLGMQSDVDAFILASDPLTYATTLQNGLAVLAEQDAIAERKDMAEKIGFHVTECKAFLDRLAVDFPEYYAEIVEHVTPKQRKKA